SPAPPQRRRHRDAGLRVDQLGRRDVAEQRGGSQLPIRRESERLLEPEYLPPVKIGLRLVLAAALCVAAGVSCKSRSSAPAPQLTAAAVAAPPPASAPALGLSAPVAPAPAAPRTLHVPRAARRIVPAKHFTVDAWGSSATTHTLLDENGRGAVPVSEARFLWG